MAGRHHIIYVTSTKLHYRFCGSDVSTMGTKMGIKEQMVVLVAVWMEDHLGLVLRIKVLEE